jgi:KUP system potassium uptake protein
MWHTPRWRLAGLGAVFLIVEVAFFTSNLSKLANGAWLPLVVGLGFAFVMMTWRRGSLILTRNRIAEEGPLDQFLNELCDGDTPIHRVPGTAVFLNPGSKTTPLALRAEVERIHTLQEKVLLVSLERVSVPHVLPARRFKVERVGRGLFKVTHVEIRAGYRDRFDCPAALAQARKEGLLERNLDLEQASYVVSRMMITPTDSPGMHRWRKALFIAMARNAASPIEQFRLPPERTVMMGSQVQL